MEPVVEKFLQGIPFAGMGTTLERNGLIGVVREMIKANKYTVDYILNYCESVGYQRKMAEEVFEELTGLSPKLIINNNEYYNAPIYVPACTIAWGMAKSKKDVAFYVVPGSYGYSVMEKNETEAPVEVTQTATIPEAINELKKVAKNIQTLDKIITSKLLETEDIQSSANDIDQTSKPYFSDPIRELKKNFKDKVIDVNAFEREAKKLVAEEKISLDEAEDLMNWEQDIINEDESYANNVLQHNEEWKPLEAEEDLSFDAIYEEFKAISSEDEDILGGKNKAEKLYMQNKSLFKDCDLLQCAERLYQLMLGFSKQEILGHSKVEKNMTKKSSDKDFEDAFENELVFDDSDNKAYFPGYEEYKFDIESDYQKMKQKALEVWKKINSSKNDIFKKDKVQPQVFETLKNTAKECGDEIWSNCFGQLVHIISYKPLENGYYELVYESINTNDENIKFYEECENYKDFDTLELLPNDKILSTKQASKKVTAENMTIEDIEEEDKTEVEKEMDKINETPIDELLEDNTPLDYFEKETQDDKVDTINDVVSKCITEFSDKFKDFNKYDIKMLSYKTKILDPYTPSKDEMISDNEINADAVLQVILGVNNKADDTNIKKLLVVFSITDGKMHWTGTVRDENDNIVAFTEEGLDSIFQEPEEVTEDII